MKPNADISYLTLGLGLWSFAEIALVLIASSAMSLPKLLRAKSKEISQVLSFVRLPFSSIASFVASSGKDSKGDSILATAEEGKRRPGYESKEYIMKSMEFETKSEAAGSWHVDDAHEIRMA